MSYGEREHCKVGGYDMHDVFGVMGDCRHRFKNTHMRACMLANAMYLGLPKEKMGRNLLFYFILFCLSFIVNCFL